MNVSVSSQNIHNGNRLIREDAESVLEIGKMLGMDFGDGKLETGREIRRLLAARAVDFALLQETKWADIDSCIRRSIQIDSSIHRSIQASSLVRVCVRVRSSFFIIKMIVVLGELGGRDEYSLVEALKQGKISKPVVAWVSGTCARLFKSEVQFGHAGAKSGGEMESPQAKNQALHDAGAVVPTSFETFETVIKETFEKLVEGGNVTPTKEV
ncbi:ATP-citrate synthase beta chain protein 1 [Camellia lanceoleosa]|uniref:ATP-citrate synthase beta chain protein 1 n=1 Tax=Camellia lanceoleosa TaxID=1840588 RepID=A0ACC0HN31_9ERIC|nr:ATP-citrate synthase beta chain protein 1 [Camellia lanceoleosa]